MSTIQKIAIAAALIITILLIGAIAGGSTVEAPAPEPVQTRQAQPIPPQPEPAEPEPEPEPEPPKASPAVDAEIDSLLADIAAQTKTVSDSVDCHPDTIQQYTATTGAINDRINSLTEIVLADGPGTDAIIVATPAITGAVEDMIAAGQTHINFCIWINT